MDKVHDASNLQCYIPPSESYRNGLTFRSSRLYLEFLLLIFIAHPTDKTLPQIQMTKHLKFTLLVIYN
jgi:hypothetical protein